MSSYKVSYGNVLSLSVATVPTEELKSSLDKTWIEIEAFKNETEIYYTPITRTWNGRSFTVEIPEGYEEFAGPSIQGGVIFAFAGVSREDGTRPMIQITLADIPTLSHEESGTISLEEFGEVMIQGVERRREQWTVEVTDSQLGHLRVKRYAWTGMTTFLGEGLLTEVRMKGIMYVGIDAGIGFALHTQDLERYAEEALFIGEHSIRTFRLSTLESQ